MSELSELFDLDPLKLSEQDIVKIVTRMREHQAQYELGAPKVAPKAPKKPTKAQDVLKDLGLI